MKEAIEAQRRGLLLVGGVSMFDALLTYRTILVRLILARGKLQEKRLAGANKQKRGRGSIANLLVIHILFIHENKTHTNPL